MTVTGKSARGEIVDFDLLKIKEQIASAPPSSDVKRRKDFIETRLRRRKKVPVTVPVTEVTPSVPKVDDSSKEDIVIKKADIETTPPTKKSTTKQKARTPKTKKDSTPLDMESTTK